MSELLPDAQPSPLHSGKKHPEGSPFLTLDEAAAYLRVSASWLERQNCPRLELGRRRVYHRPTLERWALQRSSHDIDDAATG